MTEGQQQPCVPKSRPVLIVEDNRDGRESLRQLLQLLGYRVEVAQDGYEGVEKALMCHPEVGLIDIGLPGLDGYEVARRLRSALGQSIVLIAYTAYTQPEDRERAFRAGFDAHLGKPAELEWLTDLLNRASEDAILARCSLSPEMLDWNNCRDELGQVQLYVRASSDMS